MKHLLSLFAFLTFCCLWGCGGSPAVKSSEEPNTDSGNTEGLVDDLFTDHLEGDKFLTVFMIDIGQGDSFLILTPNGKSLIVDSGPPKSRGKLITFLRAQGITSLDAALFTHPDADHIGGAVQLIENFPIKQIFDNGHVHTSPQYEAMLSAIEKAQIPVHRIKVGDQITLDEGIVLDVLAPPETLFDGTTRSDTNANTIVFRFQYGDISWYFSGDSEPETESFVLSQGKDIRSTIYKVAHHGSKHASQPQMLDALQPRIALISASKSNRYGHPTPELLARLESRNITILKTLDLGHVGLRTDGHKLLMDHSQIDHVALFQGKSTLPQKGLAATASAAEAAAPAGPRANINCASIGDLTRVKTVGERLAANIIEARESMGGFSSEEDLKKIKGVGDKRRGLILQNFYVGPKDCSAPAEPIPSSLLQFPKQPDLAKIRAIIQRLAA